jgi:uncharacterized protein (TIGR03083 family)
VTRAPRPWIAALRSSHEHLTALVEPLGPDAVDAPSMATGWSIAQVMSHLGSQAEIFGGILDAAKEGRPLPGPEAFPPVWDKWNALSPADQAAASRAANEAFVVQAEALSEAQLDELRFPMFGMDLDMAGFLQMRLSEHALHTWDVAASLDPTASVSPDAVELLIDTLPQLASRVGKPQDHPMRIRVVTADPSRDLRLTVEEGVGIEPFDGGSTEGELRLPAEAFVRLVYGRLDDSHAPAIELDGEGLTLDRLRAVFPGF